MKRVFLTALLSAGALAACSGGDDAGDTATGSETTGETSTASQTTSINLSDLDARLPELEGQIAEQEAVIESVLERIGEIQDEILAVHSAMVDRGRACALDADAPIISATAPDHDGSDAAANAASSASFLEDVRAASCVVELPSGLMLRVRTPVESGDSPVSGDLVTVHYRGQLPHGEEFDSSYSRGEPATFPSDRLISGWVEALPLMRVGERWELYIPSDLAYGGRGTPGGPIGPDQALVFELELVDLP